MGAGSGQAIDRAICRATGLGFGIGIWATGPTVWDTGPGLPVRPLRQPAHLPGWQSDIGTIWAASVSIGGHRALGRAWAAAGPGGRAGRAGRRASAGPGRRADHLQYQPLQPLLTPAGRQQSAATDSCYSAIQAQVSINHNIATPPSIASIQRFNRAYRNNHNRQQSFANQSVDQHQFDRRSSRRGVGRWAASGRASF